jgi:hypothetical protein
MNANIAMTTTLWVIVIATILTIVGIGIGRALGNVIRQVNVTERRAYRSGRRDSNP